MGDDRHCTSDKGRYVPGSTARKGTRMSEKRASGVLENAANEDAGRRKNEHEARNESAIASGKIGHTHGNSTQRQGNGTAGKARSMETRASGVLENAANEDAESRRNEHEARNESAIASGEVGHTRGNSTQRQENGTAGKTRSMKSHHG